MPKPVRIGHSPDPDDAFMFYALAAGKFDTSPESYEHHILDIETLNRKAETGEYEVTALSFHAYAYVSRLYLLLRHGGSFGDGYGPVLVAREFDGTDARAWLAGKRVAVPGLRTSAYLALQLFAADLGEGEGHGSHRRRPLALPSPPRGEGKQRQRPSGRAKRVDFACEAVPFDQILPAVAEGRYDAGLLIHEAQLTYRSTPRPPLHLVMDLGVWWKAATGLPLPLGGNAIRADIDPQRRVRIAGHILESIRWALAHRREALEYALRYARGADPATADRFVGLYVNELTLDCGAAGQKAVEMLLGAGGRARIVPCPEAIRWAE